MGATVHAEFSASTMERRVAILREHATYRLEQSNGGVGKILE
jgi:hypothetical protein